VYFVSGSACGGKTTIAGRLSEKHSVELYNWDERFVQHKERPSWEEYFSRPPEDESVRSSIKEQSEIAIVELLTLSREGSIIVDGIFSASILSRISSANRTVFLMADIEAVRADFFRRSDKADMLRVIESLRAPDQAKENVIRSIAYGLDRDIPEVQSSGFWCHVRSINADWDEVFEAVERQFGFV